MRKGPAFRSRRPRPAGASPPVRQVLGTFLAGPTAADGGPRA
ncbi:hypothetical protein GA0115261_103861, partial [Streptomyces sp. OspMP-M43]